MLNPIDINKRNMNVTPITLFLRNKNVRKKFNEFCKKYSLGRIRFIHGLFFISIFGMLLDAFTIPEEYLHTDDFSILILFCVCFLVYTVLLVFKYEIYTETTNLLVGIYLLMKIINISKGISRNYV